MSNRSLGEAINDGAALRAVNFFNGRLLSAEDLNQEQELRRQLVSRLGRAVGDGVAFGLEVEVQSKDANDPVLRVSPGLAVNRHGRSLELGSEQLVTLARPTSNPSEVSSKGGFADCDLSDAGLIAQQSGVYLLCLAPARSSEGRAQISGLGNESSACNSKTVVESVQFRLIALDLKAKGINLEPDAVLRNRLAYLCYGEEDSNIGPFRQNLFGPGFEGYGLLDRFRSTSLTDCDVPLALLNWHIQDGIRFLDMWAVRRRLNAPNANGRWQTLIGDRHRAEAEARLWQLEDDLRSRMTNGENLSVLEAKSVYRYLPPAGVLPFDPQQAPNGIDPKRFFGSISGEFVIDRAQVAAILEESLALEPLEVTNGEWPAVRIYTVKGVARYKLYRREDRMDRMLPTPAPDPTPNPEPIKRATIEVLIVDASKGIKAPTPIEQRRVGRVRLVPPKGLEISGKQESRSIGYFKGALALGFKERLLDGKVARIEMKRAYQQRVVQLSAAKYSRDLYVGPKMLDRFDDFWGRNDEVAYRFELSDVAAGTYTLKVEPEPGETPFKTQAVSFEITANENLTVLLGVWPGGEDRGLGVRLAKEYAFADFKGRKYVAIGIPKSRPIPWNKGPGPRPAQAIPIMPEVQPYLEQLIANINQFDSNNPLDPTGVQLYFDPNYDPNTISQRPYAYLVMGDQQTAYEVIAVPADKALPAAVATVRAGEAMLGGIPEFSSGSDANLDASLLGSLEFFSSAWSGLVSEEFSGAFDQAAAGDLIASAKDSLVTAKTTQAYLPGMTLEIQSALKGLALNNDVELANSSPDQVRDALITAKLSPQEATRFAGRLLGSVRNLTSSAVWSVRGANLGLDEAQLDDLESKGVTLKQLVDSVDNSAVHAISGLSSERIKQVQASASVSYNLAMQTVRGLGTELSSEQTQILAASGIASSQDLATSSVDVLASTLGTTKEEAQVFIQNAEKVVLQTIGVTAVEADAIIKSEKWTGLDNLNKFTQTNTTLSAETSSSLKVLDGALGRIGFNKTR